jgi:DNA polymerase-1
MPTLYLIDGYGQFFRAFHAIRTPMTSPVTKEPTNMSFGFIGMLLKLLRGQGPNMAAAGGRPDYLAVVIDVSGDRETFRSVLYPEYKAHRPPAPDGFGVQVDRCLATLGALGIPVVGVPGFEADDTMATLVTRLRAERPDLRIRLVTKDKDLKQLLEPVDPATGAGVEMFDVHTDTLIDAQSLKAETGLEPSQVVDALALQGDAVDNVPGVEGVGDKTAAMLICQYGTLENLIAHADEIKGKRGEKLREAIPRLGLSKQLVTLRRDVPVEFDLEAAATDRIDLEALLPILRELGFNRYQDEVRALIGETATVAAAANAAGPSRPAAAPAKPAAAQGFTGGLFDHLGGDDGDGVPSGPRRAFNANYHTVTTRQNLEALVRDLRKAPLIAIDTETTSLGAMDAELCGISIATSPGEAVYIPVRSPTPEKHLDETTVLTALKPILEDQSKPKTGHNLKYDLLVLRRAGVHLRGISQPPPPSDSPDAQSSVPGASPTGFDSMVASYLIDSSRSSHSLDTLALALLNHTNISIKELIGSGQNQKRFDQVPLDQATQYAAEDADVALRLHDVMLPQLRAMQLLPLFRDVELPLIEVLAELEWNGITVDPAELDRQAARLTGRIEELRAKIQDAAFEALGRSFNPDSPKQLASILFNKKDAAEPGLGLRVIKRLKTGPSTDTEVLEQLAGDPAVTTPIPQLILDYRQLTKLVSTYLVALKEAINKRTGRIHASFNQTVAATGRLSSSDPNLQNIPIRTEIGREIRKAFVAAPGHVLISADYSQIELRLLAHLSKDPALTEAFLRGDDVHAAVAAEVYGVPIDQVTKDQRAAAKMVNFGIVYGVTPYGLAWRLGIETKAAQEIITNYKKRFSGIATFLEECIDFARRYGYVETMLKRRRPITDLDSSNPARRGFAERIAINSVVQGSAADLIKLAMIDLHARLSENAPHWRGGRPPAYPGVKMLLQIHDELVFEAPKEIAEDVRALIVERMEKAMTLTVPLKVDSSISENWFDG